MKMISRIVGVCFVAALFLSFSGCKTSPHSTTNFIPHKELMKKYAIVPLDKVWRNPKINGANYDSVMVVPVYTKDAFSQRNWMERNNVRTWIGEENKDVQDFAKYTENAFKKRIANSKVIRLANSPSPSTLMLELSLVKVVPGKPVIGGVSNLSNLTPFGLLLSPVKVGAKAASDSPTQASVAIEGVIRDSITKEVVATFADREKQDAAFFNTDDFTAYGNLEDIVDGWARIFVECLEKKPFQTGATIKPEDKLEFVK
ncbi:MAG TPA: DUF3313 family protein [Victivallales bacterium]|nr:DUF3313 family protein [Victivallales bacterium]